MPALADINAADRRRLLGAAGALCLTTLAGCGGGGDAAGTATTGSATTGSTTTGSTSASCSVIPEETAGPYPGDGSNTNASGVANVLALAGVVRSDIRQSIGGSASATAQGVPLTVTIELVNTGSSCATLEGYAIYLWHCTREGGYSMYSSGITAENYLRGVQPTDATGRATFTTVFPGCYSGRMPHIHFEVYRNVAAATSSVNKLKTSQLAFPTAPCAEVYATSAYASSAANFARISFATDNVFADGVGTQTATVTGSVASGYTATLQVGIAA